MNVAYVRGIAFFNPFNPQETIMNVQALIPSAVAVGIAYAAAKFSSNAMVKAAAYGVIGVIVAKQIPYVQDALA